MIRNPEVGEYIVYVDRDGYHYSCIRSVTTNHGEEIFHHTDEVDGYTRNANIAMINTSDMIEEKIEKAKNTIVELKAIKERLAILNKDL